MENSMFFCRHFLKASQNDYTFFMEFFPRKCTSCWLRTDLGLANTLQNSTWTYSNSSIYTKIKHWIIKSCKGKINSFWLTSLKLYLMKLLSSFNSIKIYKRNVTSCNTPKLPCWGQLFRHHHATVAELHACCQPSHLPTAGQMPSTWHQGIKG